MIFRLNMVKFITYFRNITIIHIKQFLSILYKNKFIIVVSRNQQYKVRIIIMSGRIAKTATRTLKYFTNPLIEGKYQVVPPPKVPSHIQAPLYVNNQNPTFGQYQGPAVVHTPEAVSKLRKSAKIASHVLGQTQKFIIDKYNKKQPLTQEQIDRFVFDTTIAQNAYPTPIGFMNFPKSVCISVNQCIVHGIPSVRPLEEGDKINIDVTVYYDGYHGDNNLTVFYGPPKHEPVKRIAQLAQQALYKAISICRPGTPFNQVGKVIQDFAEQHKITICDDFSGHGIGHLLHMPPMVLHKYYPALTDIMQVGSVFTIQPIFTLNPITQAFQWRDGFTVICPDNPNAQFQHTILIVEEGCQILTLRKDQRIPNPNGNIKNLT